MANSPLTDEEYRRLYNISGTNITGLRKTTNMSQSARPPPDARTKAAREVRKNQLRRGTANNATRRAINEKARIRNQEAVAKAVALAAEVQANQNRFIMAIPNNLPAPRNENNEAVNKFYRQFEDSSRSRKKRKARKSRR